MQTTVPALVIRRVYAAPPQRLYAVWTDPQLAQFLCPQGMTVNEASMDVRVGGSYKIDMRTAEGEAYIAYGTYREVQPPSRLSMTWQWQEDNPAEEHETLLTLEFNAHGEGTELVLTHEHLSSPESRANHEHGWTSMLQKLHCAFGTLVATVELPVPPERVFDALASQEVTQWWVRPGVFDTREWNGDVRAGGQWNASGLGRGEPYALDGEFIAVQRPQKLVHTWRLAGNAASETTVTYTLEPTANGTRLTLEQGRFGSPETCTNTLVGWETSFERLSEILATPS